MAVFWAAVMSNEMRLSEAIGRFGLVGVTKPSHLIPGAGLSNTNPESHDNDSDMGSELAGNAHVFAMCFSGQRAYEGKICDMESDHARVSGLHRRRTMTASKTNGRSRQEELGQFLTAVPTADFMASMFGPLPSVVRLLDAGAQRSIHFKLSQSSSKTIRQVEPE